MAAKDYTAIARSGYGENTSTRVIRATNYYTSKKDFEDDIRGNGLRVVHVFDHIADDFEVELWLFWNRKNG